MERKSIWEMIGEFLREAGLLMVVFIPIDVLIGSRWSASLYSLMALGILGIIIGMVIERRR
jgi:hypothetical protein